MIRRDRDVIFEPMTEGKNMATISQVRRQAFKLEMVLGLARFAKIATATCRRIAAFSVIRIEPLDQV
jgi:hypothetical protein